MISSTRWSIVRAAKSGDATSLARLCEKYRPAMLAFLRRRGLGPDAEDVAQEALLALVQALPKVEPSAGRFRGLVFAVARNKLRTHVTRRAAAKRGGGDVQMGVDLEAVVSPEIPESDFDLEWIAALLKRCLTRLEEDQPQQYAALRDTLLAGRGQADAARDEGLSPATMRKRVQRGRAQIAAYLREEVKAYGRERADVREELDHLATLLGPLALEA